MVLVLFEQLRSCNSGNVKSTAHIAEPEICQIPPESISNFCPLSFFHPLTVCTLPPPHVHERQNPETGQPPHSRRGTLLHIHNWAPLSHKPLPLSHSSSHQTQFTASHPAPHPPALAGCTGLMQNKILWKQSSGQGWAAMTVPQHNLFYLTPANASEQTADHGGAQRTHSAPSFTFDRFNDDQKLFSVCPATFHYLDTIITG